MWIVRLALRRPYTVAVMALLILVMGILSLTRMIVDIFPAIDIPVVLVAWNYPGLSAEEMERPTASCWAEVTGTSSSSSRALAHSQSQTASQYACRTGGPAKQPSFLPR